MRRRRTFVTNRSIPCSFLYSLGSFQSNLFCSKAKPCRTTKETFFNRNNTAQISQSLPFAEKSNFCIAPLCSMFVSFLPPFVPIKLVMFQSKAVWKYERNNGTDFPKFTWLEDQQSLQPARQMYLVGKTLLFGSTSWNWYRNLLAREKRLNATWIGALRNKLNIRLFEKL